jgi:hypothetical protein
MFGLAWPASRGSSTYEWKLLYRVYDIQESRLFKIGLLCNGKILNDIVNE